MEEHRRSSERPARAGEKAFALILLLLGAAAFAMALALWRRMSAPRAASAAALPLFVSGLWVVLALVTVIENAGRAAPPSGGENRLRGALRRALPRNVAVMLGAVVLYCALLVLRVNFYIATPLFLYGAMCFLTRGSYVKNLLWTAVVMAFIVLVFRLLFGVVFP